MNKSYSNNLQLTRFTAAALVIVSHSFAVTQGTGEKEWLYVLTNGQLTLGALSVATFFLCGGYLSARGISKYVSVMQYVFARLKRLLPSLWFVVIACLLLGGFITTLTPAEYFTNSATYRYLLNCVMLLQYNLPGVFENSVYLPTVNGSLWTLPVELACNIVFYCGWKLCFITQQGKRKIILAIFLIGSVFLLFGSISSFMRRVLRPCLLFAVGILYEMYSDKIVLKTQYVQLALGGLIISAVFGLLDLGMLIAFPYIMITFWFGMKEQCSERIATLGKYSYQIYLWGFPVQHFIAWCSDYQMSPWLNAVFAIPISIVLATLTYHIVERQIKRRNI